MTIHHVSLWSTDIDVLKRFYVSHFGAQAGPIFEDARGFKSYMLSFAEGAQIEIMQMPGVLDRATPAHDETHHVGLHHFAISQPTPASVDRLVGQCEEAGSRIIKAPHATDDGFYEAMITDPDGNLVEIAVPPPG